MRILISGGGLAGLSAAINLGTNGHDITMCTSGVPNQGASNSRAARGGVGGSYSTMDMRAMKRSAVTG